MWRSGEKSPLRFLFGNRLQPQRTQSAQRAVHSETAAIPWECLGRRGLAAPSPVVVFEIAATPAEWLGRRSTRAPSRRLRMCRGSPESVALPGTRASPLLYALFDLRALCGLRGVCFAATRRRRHAASDRGGRRARRAHRERQGHCGIAPGPMGRGPTRSVLWKERGRAPVVRGGSTVSLVEPLGRSRSECRLLLTGLLS